MNQNHVFFKFETDLQKRLSLTGAELFTSPNLTILERQEVPVGNCIPDHIFVAVPNITDINFCKRGWTYRHAHIAWLLRTRQRLKLETIASRSFESPEKIQKLLHEMQQSGVVIENSTGSFSLAGEYRALRFLLVSVEAKLHRWRDALRQALMYKPFSDATYVAMDASALNLNKEIMHEFKKNNVGLCLMYPDAHHWVLQPKFMRVESPEKEFLITSAICNQRQLWSRQ